MKQGYKQQTKQIAEVIKCQASMFLIFLFPSESGTAFTIFIFTQKEMGAWTKNADL
jgi:hypothetical protein